MFYAFTILFFLLIGAPKIKSADNELDYFTSAENKLPESRLLIDRQQENTEKNTYIEKEKNNNEIIKKEKIKIIKKLDPKKNYKFKINFIPEEEKPSAEEIKIFYDNLVKLDKNSSITIKGYAKKRDNDSTSKVRRLSLKRALFLRSLLIQENYKISQIYIKALGNDSNLQGNKDVVIISIN